MEKQDKQVFYIFIVNKQLFQSSKQWEYNFQVNEIMCIFLKLGWLHRKAEQALQGMELQEKETQKN